VMTWRAALALRARWISLTCAVLTGIYFVARIAGTRLLWPQWPKALIGAFGTVLKYDRLAFLVLLLTVVVLGQSRARRISWLGLGSLLLGTIGLYAPELSQLGVPGIWFPFGVGVSRTEYAYAAMVILLAAYLVQRLWRFVPAAAAAKMGVQNTSAGNRSIS
jgi:hypothetical protein